MASFTSQWYTPNFIADEIIVTDRSHFVSKYILAFVSQDRLSIK